MASKKLSDLGYKIPKAIAPPPKKLSSLGWTITRVAAPAQKAPAPISNGRTTMTPQEQMTRHGVTSGWISAVTDAYNVWKAKAASNVASNNGKMVMGEATGQKFGNAASIQKIIDTNNANKETTYRAAHPAIISGQAAYGAIPAGPSLGINPTPQETYTPHDVVSRAMGAGSGKIFEGINNTIIMLGEQIKANPNLWGSFNATPKYQSGVGEGINLGTEPAAKRSPVATAQTKAFGDKLIQYGLNSKKEDLARLTELGYIDNGTKSSLFNAIEAVPEVGTMLLLAFASPPAAAALGGILASGNSYVQYTNNGVPVDKATKYALTKGALTAIVYGTGLGAVTEGLGTMADTITKQLVAVAADSLTKGLVYGGARQLASNVVDITAYDKWNTMNPDETVSAVMKGVLSATITATLMSIPGSVIETYAQSSGLTAQFADVIKKENLVQAQEAGISPLTDGEIFNRASIFTSKILPRVQSLLETPDGHAMFQNFLNDAIAANGGKGLSVEEINTLGYQFVEGMFSGALKYSAPAPGKGQGSLQDVPTVEAVPNTGIAVPQGAAVPNSFANVPTPQAKDIVENGTYGIFSTYTGDTTPEANAAKALAYSQETGRDILESQYVNREKAHIVSADEVKALAEKYNQQTYLVASGHHYEMFETATGKKIMEGDAIAFDNSLPDFYTEVQTANGPMRFSMDLHDVAGNQTEADIAANQTEANVAMAGAVPAFIVTPTATNGTISNAAQAPVSGMSGTTGPFLSAKILKALPVLRDMTPHAVMRWAGITEDQISAMSDKSVAGFAKRVETAYNVAKTKYGKNMAEVVSTMVKPYEQWGLEEYNSIREFSASILGEENVDLVTKILAATSAGMQVGANVTLTEKALGIILTEGRLPTGADGFMSVHIENMRKILAGIELPKVGEFAQAILGNDSALVIDRWMARFWFNAENPTNEQRLVAKALTTQVAKKSGMTPREMQAAIWQYARETAGEKAEGSFAKYGEMKAHADEIGFLQDLLAKRNAVNTQPITSKAGNVNEITPFATDGAISPRAAAAQAKLDRSGYNAPSSATLFYESQYGGQQQSGTGAAPTTITITAGGNPVLTNQQGQPVEVLPALLKIKPIRNVTSQDKLSHTEELYKDDINVLRALGYVDGYTYKLLTVIRGSSTTTEYALLHGLALLPDGKKQAFAPGVKLTPFMELGETLKKNGLTEEDLNKFSILYAGSRGNPVNLDSMPKVNMLKQGKGTLADKLDAVKRNALAELAAYTPEQYALLKGVMDEAHKYLTPIVNAMHASGMPLGKNLDSFMIDDWIDAYVSSAEPNSSGMDASSPTQEKNVETVSHKKVTGYLNGIVNTMNRYNQWFEYNEYVKRFSTEMGYTSDKAVKGAPTFFVAPTSALDEGVRWVDAPDHIKRQLTSIVSRAHATWGLLNSDIYSKLMTAERELKLMTPAFAQTNTVRDGALVLTRYGIHPVAMANTILKLIIGKSEKSSGLVGMGTPNELSGNVFKDFQNIDHAVALTHMQRLFQYVHDNVLGASESLGRNYAFNVEQAGGKSEIEQMYALIASSADFTVYGSSETAANIRKAWQFSQASLDVSMTWDLAIKELGTKIASDNMGVKFEGFSAAAILIASIAAGIAFKAREKERKELQDYVSQNKIPIRQGSKIITIPEGFSQGAMLENTISTIVAGMLNNDSVGEITSGLAQDVYGGLVGMIGRDGDLSINSIISTLTPTLFEPITRVLRNTQYGGGAIDPMTWGMNWTHYFTSTTRVAKNLARELHDKSGGKIDVSPIKMDYLIKSYLARYGTALTKMDSSGVKSAVSGFMAQQFVVPVPQGIKTQAYSDWQDGYAMIADDLAQARKGNFPMSQAMANDIQLLNDINTLFPKQTTAQAVYGLALYGSVVLDAYAEDKKKRK